MESTQFIFDNQESRDMGLSIVRMSGGMVESPFLSKSSIKEKKAIHNYKPYFQGVEKHNLEFNITVSPLENKWTPEFKRKIGKWLGQNSYKEFQTYDDLGKYYYAKCVNAANLNTVDERGYLELTFRTNSPYAYSPVHIVSYNLLSNPVEGTTINVVNESNIDDYFYPKIEFILDGTETDFSITNLSDNNRLFEFTELTGGETVSIDNYRQIILSDIPEEYRLKYFNKNWLRLLYGENSLLVKGKCELQIKMQFPIIQ